VAQRGHETTAWDLAQLYSRGAPGVELDKAKAIRWLESIQGKPRMERLGRVVEPQGTMLALELGRRYCEVSDKEKALPMYKLGYNVGDAEAQAIMKRECR
jgi:TPR repeat protein